MDAGEREGAALPRVPQTDIGDALGRTRALRVPTLDAGQGVSHAAHRRVQYMARGTERYTPGHSEDREHATLCELDVSGCIAREDDLDLNEFEGLTISKTTRNYEGGSQVRGAIDACVLVTEGDASHAQDLWRPADNQHRELRLLSRVSRATSAQGARKGHRRREVGNR